MNQLSLSLLVGVCAGLWSELFGLAADSNLLRLISAPQPGPGLSCRSGAGGSFAPVLSADARFVVFLSQANNLVTNDDQGLELDVFARDLIAGTTLLVSVGTNGRGGAQRSALFPSISTNGHRVFFSSGAANLVTNNANGVATVLARDSANGTTWVAPLNTNGRPSGVRSYMISDDSRWLFFESDDRSLVPQPSGTPILDIFARDLLSNQTYLVSDSINRSSGGPPPYPACQLSSVTPDGRYVAFVYTANSSVTQQVLVRDMQSGSTLLASADVASYLAGAFKCYNAVISADGRYVAFEAGLSACCSQPFLLFWHDLQAGATRLISTNTSGSGSPQISADGRFLAYDDGSNVLVWDAQALTNILASINRDNTGPGNDISRAPILTPDGRSVAFVSAATDLVTNASNGCFQIYIRDLMAGTTRLVSANLQDAASSADMELATIAISADGRRIVFDSTSDDLVANDSNQASDVFVRDLNRATTQLVSECDPARTRTSSVAFSTIANASCISSNARWVTFSCPDGDLAPGDTNGWPDVFVRDLFTGTIQCAGFGTNAAVDQVISADARFVAFTRFNTTEVWRTYGVFSAGDIYRYDVESSNTTLVTVKLDGDAAGLSSLPAISPDGRYVAFQSRASGLVSQGSSTNLQVFLRDMEFGTNFLVSVNTNGNFGNYDSRNPSFSPDGRWLLFLSSANNLAAGSTFSASTAQVFARDLSSNQTVLVSKPATQSGDARYSAFSPDSRYAVFATALGNGLPTSTVWVRDLLVDTNAVSVASVFFNAGSLRVPVVSSSARYVVYEQWSPTNSNDRQIMLRDRQTGATNLISVNRTRASGGNNASGSPFITPDGQFVIFSSKASDLVYGDTNNATDIFVRDRLQNLTLLVSANANGQSGDSASSRPALAADGRTVVFMSFADDLVAGDYNAKRDVFMLRLSAGDTDGDGMDDDWEVAYFGDFSHDGTADSDGDGLTDLAEFRAGTNPTSGLSVLRAMTLTSLSGSGTTILWSAAPGRTYQVQYKDNLNDTGWTTLPGTVTANGSTASTVDSSASAQGQRFYRVGFLP